MNSSPTGSRPSLDDAAALVDLIEARIISTHSPVDVDSRLVEHVRLLLDRKVPVAEAEHLAALGQGQQLVRAIPDFLVFGQ